MQRAVDKAMDRSTVSKAHLMLGGMHINIHIGGLNLEKQNKGGMTAMIQNILIGLAHGMRHHLVANRSTIDKKVLQISLTSRKRRQTHPAPEPNTGADHCPHTGRLS